MAKKKATYNIGIALGGGGARGYAHLGALEALREKGIEADIISGVSSGAIVGAFIASGKTPKEAFQIMKRYNFTGLTALSSLKQGLLSLSKMKANLEQTIEQKYVENLPIPLIVTVSNMLEGKVEYMKEGPLSTIVQASASIPVLFSPVKYNGQLYSDGGMFDNLPTKPLTKMCEKIIAISISPVQRVDQLKNLKDVAVRMFQLTINANKKYTAKRSDVFIEPPELIKHDIMDAKNANRIYEIGYNYVKHMDISI